MLFRERGGNTPYRFAYLSGLPGIERIVVTMCDSRRCCTSAIYRPCSASRRALGKLLYSTGTFKSYSVSTKCVDNRRREFRKGEFNSGELWFDLASVIDEQTGNNYEVILKKKKKLFKSKHYLHNSFRLKKRHSISIEKIHSKKEKKIRNKKKITIMNLKIKYY